MNLPPLPPRPLSSYAPGEDTSRPPLPPLPPQLAHEVARHRDAGYAAPRPQRYDNPVDRMTATAARLEDSVGGLSFPTAMPAAPNSSGYGPPPPQYPPPQQHQQPYGSYPSQPSYAPPQPAPPQQPQWQSGSLPSPWNAPRPLSSASWGPQTPQTQHTLPPWGAPVQAASGPASPLTSPPSFNSSLSSVSQSLADLSFSSPAPQQAPSQQPPPRRDPTPEKGPPSVVAPLPTVASLTSAAGSVSASNDPVVKVRWSKDVLALVDRVLPAAKTKGDAGSQITDLDLVRLTDAAIKHLLAISGSAGNGQIPSYVAEALYLRGNLSSSGSFPAYLPRDPRAAFKDFEFAARSGYAPAWFKLGRDYESVNDVAHARDCFEQGLAGNETSCLYRMGMANLLGQLGLQKNPQAGIVLLRQAAEQADVDVPQPAYVFGMLLLGEFDQVDLPVPLIMSTLPLSTASNPNPRDSEARRRIERAAYLAFAPAQYKLGWAYEYAKIGCPFDPLLSVQYYSLASQQGETEADMALSKWFLCGSEGAFEKDETLAVTFAEKAAKKGLPSAEFAMGYYCEVGIGGPKDLNAAKKWYQRAAHHNNADAVPRLQALSQSQPEALSREQHNALTDTTLVRKRTAAKEYSMANGMRNGERRAGGANEMLSEARKVAAAARQEQTQMANDGLPMPSYPTSNPNSPRASPRASPKVDPRPLPSNTEARRYSSPGRDRPSEAPRPSLPPGQQPLPGAGGRFGRREDTAGLGRGGGGQGRPNPAPRHDSWTMPGGGIDLSQPAPARRPAKSPAAARPQSFSLNDDGPSPGSGPTPNRPTGFNNPPGGTGRPPSQPRPSAASSPPVQSPPPAQSAPAPRPQPNKGNGPQTFAEMGFHSAPVQDKDCIIM